jgi:predicted DNA-binding antitoxin AbrB/MazE fold protein
MKSVPAIYQNGVFRPLEKVELPEEARVEVLLPLQLPADLRPELAAIYEVLTRRHRTGEPDLAGEHDQHQP